MQSNNMEQGIHAKLYLHGARGCVKEIRRLHVSRSLSWEGLREKVREIFGMEGEVDLSYQDPEGDQVILSCEGEWQECIHLNTDAQQPHLRINVQPKKRKCGRSPSPTTTTTTTTRRSGCPHHHNHNHNHHQTRQAEDDHENENENATQKDGCGQADRNGDHEWNRHWWTELTRAYTIGCDGSQQQHRVTEGLEEVSATVCGLVNRFLGDVGQVSEWLQPALNRTMDEVDVNVKAFGHCLHRRGLWLMKRKEYTAACELFQNAAQLQPRRAASHLYNAACCQALLNHPEEAINTLQQAVAEGYCNLRHMLADEDLSSLRELRGFEEIVQGMVERMEERFGGEGGEGGWKGRWWRRKHQMAATQHQHQQPQATPQNEEEASRESSSVGERNDIISAETSSETTLTMDHHHHHHDDETSTSTATAGGEESSVVVAEAEAEVPNAQPPSVQSKAEEEPEEKEEQPTPLSRAVEEEEAHPSSSSSSSGVKVSADMALRFEAELVSLCGMGFMDVDRNLCALVESGGRLAEAVERLLE